MRTDNPVRDANLYWSDRYSEVLCYCAACGGEIYGAGDRFEDDEYWLDEDGNTVHMTGECVIRHIRNKGQSQGGARI